MTSFATENAEIIINKTSAGNQHESNIVALVGGGYVVTWTSDGQDGSGQGVYQQMYDEFDKAVTGEMRISSVTDKDQNQTSVAALAGGGWVVTYRSDGEDGVEGGIYQRIYSSQGLPLTSAETLVNTTTDKDQSSPQTSVLSDGGWMTFWQGYASYQDSDGNGGFVTKWAYHLFMQRFDENGNKVGDEQKFGNLGAQQPTDLSSTALSNGGVVLATTDSSFGADQDIWFGFSDANGNGHSPERVNNNSIPNDQNSPFVTQLQGGGWLIGYVSCDADGVPVNIYQRRYSATGAALGNEVIVSTDASHDKANASAVALLDGGWVVVWQSKGQEDTGRWNIYQQRYDADGNKQGDETRINGTTGADNTDPRVTTCADGTWVVSWTAEARDGDGTAIIARRFAPDLHGNSKDDHIIGTAVNDHLYGEGGNDILDGGKGDDVMTGGIGNDTYIVDSVNDRVEELAEPGIDTVQSYVTYSIKSVVSVENLTLLEDKNAITAIGNSSANVLTGNSNDNTLLGYEGNDTLIGGVGADIMKGDIGNDTYDVDNVHDQVIELDKAGDDTVRSSLASYKLGDFVERLTLNGTANINGFGNDLANVLTGNSGNNYLDGGKNADVMQGGGGNDTYVVDNAGDQVIESTGGGIDTVRSYRSFSLSSTIENVVLIGTLAINAKGNQFDNTLVGNAAVNVLEGLVGNDYLDGGVGSDKMYGGAGNDTYVVDRLTDLVSEQGGQGTDTVKTWINGYHLANNVENLVLTGTGKLTAYGNSLANKIYGNARDNYLDGGANNDTVQGGGGNDKLIGNTGDDRLYGGIGNDRLYGGAGTDYLYGDVGNDRLYGNGGRDRLYGGRGNDIYYVESGDRIEEVARNGGVDTVYSTTSFALSNYVERLHLGAKGNLKGTGSATDNWIYGNSHNNVLKGLAGKDYLVGGGGKDSLLGGNGNDKLFGGNGNDKLDGGAGKDFLRGDGGNDNLKGAGGNDTLNGGAGKDTLDGGGGKDNLGGGAGNDKLIGGAGNDKLSGQKGNDNLSGGKGNDNLIGGDGKDVLRGDANKDKLDGGNGNDRLWGGAGDDKMKGGKGADTFEFHSKDGKDHILDFKHGQDHIDLSHVKGIDNFADVKSHIKMEHGNVTLHFGKDVLILDHVHKVVASDFHF